MSYYPEPDSHIRDKLKVLRDLSNHATEKEVEYATGVDASDLVAQKDFTNLKAEVDKLDMLNWLMLQLVWMFFLDELDVGKLKAWNN